MLSLSPTSTRWYLKRQRARIWLKCWRTVCLSQSKPNLVALRSWSLRNWPRELLKMSCGSHPRSPAASGVVLCMWTWKLKMYVKSWIGLCAMLAWCRPLSSRLCLSRRIARGPASGTSSSAEVASRRASDEPWSSAQDFDLWRRNCTLWLERQSLKNAKKEKQWKAPNEWIINLWSYPASRL